MNKKKTWALKYSGNVKYVFCVQEQEGKRKGDQRTDLVRTHETGPVPYTP